MSKDNSDYKKSLLSEKNKGSDNTKLRPLSDRTPESGASTKQSGKKSKR